MKLVPALWAHNASRTIFIHLFPSMMAKCIMKVEFSRKIYALFTRYSLLNNPMGNQDSNMLALSGAEAYAKIV
jgi:hypothetical protein